MDNSLVTHLRGYYEALFQDIAPQYSNQREWKRDLTRLLSTLEVHGSRVATMELPIIGKYLERGIATGSLPSSSHFLSRKRKGTNIPIFMGNLFGQLFSDDGVLRNECDAGIVDSIRQVAYASKKLRLDCAQHLVYAEVSNFFSIEDQILEPTLPWGSEDLDLDRTSSISLLDADQKGLSVQCREALSRLQRISDIVSSQLGDFSQERPFELPKHGPGVVSNLRRGVSKYSFPEWSEKLSRVFPYDAYVWVDYDQSCVRHTESLLEWEKETPSRLIAVPKTQKGPRLIAAEPVQNQWIQQLILSQLSSRLAETSIGSAIQFRSQDRNRDLALRGSVDGTFGTIDLSSASDRLSCWTVERVFRGNHSFLERLNASRTAYLSNSLDKKSRQLCRLKKFAAMGSACTFPVQSVVYALIATAVLHPEGRINSKSVEKASRLVQVFGDDIIVPRTAFELTCELLTALGLKVNQEKSFNTGLFRESCGMDAFQGVDVTPAYLLEPDRFASLTTVSSFVAVANNHFRKGLWHAASYLDTCFATYRHLLPILSTVRDDIPLSLASFVGSSSSHLRVRWNNELQRSERRVLRSVSKQKELQTDGLFQLMKFLHEPSEPTVRFTPEGVIEPIVRTLCTTGRGTSLARPGWDSLNF